MVGSALEPKGSDPSPLFGGPGPFIGVLPFKRRQPHGPRGFLYPAPSPVPPSRAGWIFVPRAVITSPLSGSEFGEVPLK